MIIFVSVIFNECKYKCLDLNLQTFAYKFLNFVGYERIGTKKQA